MNYRLLLSEMLIDYTERMSKETNLDKRKVYREILNDLKLALDIEPSQIALLNEAKALIK